jgi:hypothetical protein
MAQSPWPSATEEGLSMQHVVIIYESLTGNTKRAAWLMGDEFFRHGVATRLFPANAVDADAVAAADLVIVGSWVDGLFVVGQRVGRHGRIKALPSLSNKKCLVYATFAINPGKVLDKLSATVTNLGGDVLGGMTIRRDDLQAGSVAFVDRALSAISV